MGKEHFIPDAHTCSNNDNEVKIPSDVGIYTHDIVKLKNDSTKIGIVSQVAGDVDSDSDITDEDEGTGDDNDNNVSADGGNENHDVGDEEGVGHQGHIYGGRNDALPSDQVRVVWMDQSETTHNLADLTVLDRAFLHGDIVAAASDTTGQVGVVEDVTLSVDLLAPNGSIIKDVSSKYLKRVRDYIVGDYVVFGPWLGRVDDVLDNVTLLFDDGSMCKVIKADPLRLKPVSKSFLEDGHFPYYPGQRVRASSSSVFKNARWLSGMWKASRMDATVTHVAVGSVFVYWIASAGYGPDCATTPAEEQNPKNLKLLSCFAHTSWQVGDWCLIPSQAVSSDNTSYEINSDECNSRDQEREHGTEGVPLDETGENCSSLQNVMEIDHDTTPNQENHDGNVETNISLKSRSSNSSLSVSKESMHETRPVHRKKMRKVLVRREKKARRKDENFERALLIVNTKTRVDVVWQDGRRELGIVSTSLVPIDNPGDQEFLAEQYVVEKAAEDEDDFRAVRRVGVVKSVNAKERTACVRWLKSVSRPEDHREFDKEEVVSVYELETHPDFDYCYGDVVVRLIPVSLSGNKESSMGLVNETSELVDLNKAETESHSPNEEVEEISNSNSHVEFSDLSWVGNISGLKDGDIEVTWADGMVSTVGPQAIYVVGRDDDEESMGAGSDVSDDDAASWETLNEDETETIETAEEELQSQNPDNIITAEVTREDSEDINSVRNGPLSIPLAALGFTTRLFTGFFTRAREQIDPLLSDYSSGNEPQSPGTVDNLESRESIVESSSQESAAKDSYPAQPISENEKQDMLTSDAAPKGKEPESLLRFGSEEADAHSMMQSHGNNSCSFKHFDTAKDPLDHFFLGANVQGNSGRKWLKKVQQDWSILQKNLPDSIYVRVYEDRMDLLRAVIVGAYGTPYQDGLFVFDFHLPPEYPQVPPSAHYHSGGWRINPNLYEEGKVCLSLLNTWTGRGNEVWDPSSSSILQVLVSLQGLVLNSKPYFNEAGYDKQVGTAEGEKNSLSYNENTFLLNCKSVMYLLRKPPKDFEELIKDHFRRRGKYILKACDAYMKGYLIGTLRDDASLSDKSEENSTSVGFKLMLAKILPKLMTSLNDVGADVEEFKHLCQSC